MVADVVVADLLGDGLMVLAGQRQHVGVHVDADHLALGAGHLGGDPAHLAGAGAQVQHCVSRPHEGRRVPTAVVALDDLVGEDLQVGLVVRDRGTEGFLAVLGALGVAGQDSGFFVVLHGGILRRCPGAVSGI